MSERWIGKSVKRVEDFRLLTGRGTFIDDHPPVGNIHHAAIVRSRHAHARIVGYDVSKALAADGVVAVITDRKSTRLNSSHLVISYAVFCLKKKKNKHKLQ